MSSTINTTNGWIYCISNPAMPGLLKIGMTERTPDIRLSEANTSNTWIPMPFVLEMAKRVTNPEQKEKTLHKLLEQYTERINPRREFFRVTLEEVKVFFDLIDGEMWSGVNAELVPITAILENEEPQSAEDVESITSDESLSTKQLGCRDMTKCFSDGQYIRHVIGGSGIPPSLKLSYTPNGCDNETFKVALGCKNILHPTVWQGIYNRERNKIIVNQAINGEVNIEYKSLSSFAQAHYRAENSNRISANGWAECECYVNGQWISTYNLCEL